MEANGLYKDHYRDSSIYIYRDYIGIMERKHGSYCLGFRVRARNRLLGCGRYPGRVACRPVAVPMS